MEKWQLETGERLASIESSIKYIEQNLSNLPPSPQCQANHTLIEKRFEENEKRIKEIENFRQYVLQRIAWVSGAFAVVGYGIFYVFDYIRDHISLK